MKKAKLLITFLLIWLFGSWLGQNVPLEDNIQLLDLVLTSSSLVFAVVGIWLALVFPEVITGALLTDKAMSERKENIEKAFTILSPLIYASFIFLLCLVVRFGVVIAKYKKEQLIEFSVLNCFFGYGFLFGFIFLMAILLAFTLLKSLLPGVYLLYKAKENYEYDKQKERIFSNTKKK